MTSGRRIGGRAVEWLQNPVARALLAKKHSLAVLLYLYRNGSGSTSDVIRGVGGHPASLLETLRSLERIGTLIRDPPAKSGQVRDARLTVKGIQLLETPVCRWDRLLRDWHRLPSDGAISVSELNP